VVEKLGQKSFTGKEGTN